MSLSLALILALAILYAGAEREIRDLGQKNKNLGDYVDILRTDLSKCH